MGLIAGTAAHLARTQLQRRRAARDEAEVVSACRLLVGLLRVGQVPGGALQLAAAESPVLAEAAAAQRAGGSVAEVLRAGAVRPGQAGLSELAVAWELAERTGASMTSALDSVVERQAAASGVAEVVASELAAPRATGRLLAVLPLAGLALGFAVGGDPLSFLLGSMVGQVSLTAGVTLACVGVLWTDWLARPGVR
ncbi:type II secretion system F family protein [Propionicimonas paludicola]|uniref:type II secretion system F family protein n=1 Tax=Propionicimonas paludicola TaxID=185243 RepID=UPI0011798FB4|nr:pilus assembly protein TadB [Propionicimonas paludicola]